MTKNEKDLEIVDTIINSTGVKSARAYDALFNIYYTQILRYVKTRFPILSEDDAEDCAIEGLTKAFKKDVLTKYEPTNYFSTFVYKIVLNQTLDFLRKEKKRDTLYIEDLNTSENSSPTEYSVDYRTPEGIIFGEETFDLIKFCIGELSNAQQGFVYLSVIEELNNTEIVSRVWGDEITEAESLSFGNAVRTTIFRGKKVLQGMLEERGIWS